MVQNFVFIKVNGFQYSQTILMHQINHLLNCSFFTREANLNNRYIVLKEIYLNH